MNILINSKGIRVKLNSTALLFAALLLVGCQPITTEATKTENTSSPQTTVTLPADYANYDVRDIQDEIFYFVLPDRFYNANPANDNGSTDKAISAGGYDPTTKWGYHGGDIEGLEAKLDYLKDMGITSVWLTPILRNKAMQGSSTGNHGYWVVDFTEIDPHFGSNEDLKQLIASAHDRNMKVFFDIITNHTADVIKYKECHNADGSLQEGNTECAFKSSEQVAKGDKYTPFIPAGEENVKKPEWLNDPKYYNNQGDSFWRGESALKGDFVGLDDINTKDPFVVQGFIDIYKNIISEFKPDGFRVDTVKHVDMSFWQEFTPAIIEHANSIGIDNFFVFGEVYSADPVVLSSFTTLGNMPSVLDFGFQNAVQKTLLGNGNPTILQELFINDDYYSDADSHANLLMNFIGNHDMGRAGLFINQSFPEASEQEKMQRLTLAHALMYFSRGVPVVYYGDEQGFTGDAGDVDAREDMFPSQVPSYNDNNLLGTDATTADDNFDKSHPIYQALQSFAKLRMEHKALRRGVTYNRFFAEDKHSFAIARVVPEEAIEYLVAVNSGNETETITFDATAQSYATLAGKANVKLDGKTIQLELAPLSFVLLKANQAIEAVTDFDVKIRGIKQRQNRTHFTFAIPGAESAPLPIVNVKYELPDQSGAYQVVGNDHSLPYQLIIDNDKLAQFNSGEIRVTVTNQLGKGLQKKLVYKVTNDKSKNSF